MIRNNMIEIITIFLHLLNGEVAKIPATLVLSQSCNDKIIELTSESLNYKGQKIFAYYCKTAKGEWVK